jgi:dipeptide/tripeptide permease
VGQRRTVILGGALMAIGHFLMAVESLFFHCFCLVRRNPCLQNRPDRQGDHAVRD